MSYIDEWVETKWSYMTRQHYEKLGYAFTKYNESFLVKPWDLPSTSGVKIHVECDNCGVQTIMTSQAYHARLDSNEGHYYCKKCGRKNYWNKQRNDGFAKKQMKIYYDYCDTNHYVPLSQIDDYEGWNTQLEFKCPKHGTQTIIYSQIRQGTRCRQCGYETIREKNRTPLFEIKQYFDDSGIEWINPREYINARKKNLQVKCPECGELFTTSYELFKKSLGVCQKCAYKIRSVPGKLTVDDIIDICNNLDVEILNPHDYQDCQTKNLKIKCSGCGQVIFRTITAIKYGYTNCPNCYPSSKGEETINRILNKYSIRHQRQKKFSDCVDKLPLPFDFYLPDYNMVIQFDGKHHFEPVFSLQDFLICKKHDNIKNLYCERNGIYIIRIPYTKQKQLETILVQQLQLM